MRGHDKDRPDERKTQRRGLREGFTTGSAATAAIVAALRLLLQGVSPDFVEIPVPPAATDPSIRLRIPVDSVNLLSTDDCPYMAAHTALARVIKDGGDDPDVTNGMPVEALVSRSALGSDPLLLAPDLFLYAGEGIGTVTLPGLPVPAGEAAVNPGPRSQIIRAVAEARDASGYTGPLHCLIRFPNGSRLAKNTLNPRLGIVNGLSVLGTGGTVRAYSHDAWKATITGCMDVALATGTRDMALSTGRRSEKLLMAAWPDIPPAGFIQAGDFAAFSLREAASRNFGHLIWGCFPGKLVKLAQGLEWTHARAAATDLDLLSGLMRSQRVPAAIMAAAAAMPTAAGRLDHLLDQAPDAGAHCLAELAALAAMHMRSWLGTDGPALTLQVFSLDGRLLFRLDPNQR